MLAEMIHGLVTVTILKIDLVNLSVPGVNCTTGSIFKYLEKMENKLGFGHVTFPQPSRTPVTLFADVD